jgi:hypothetical protein
MMGSKMALPTKDEISSQLYAVAAARSKHHGLGFGEGADQDLKSMALEAAERILEAAKNKPKENAEDYVRGAVRVGSEAMSTFVDEMVVSRLKIPNYMDSHPETIGEDTFRRAKSVLCPIWPICK